MVIIDVIRILVIESDHHLTDKMSILCIVVEPQQLQYKVIRFVCCFVC